VLQRITIRRRAFSRKTAFGAIPFFQPHQQIESPRTLQHLGDDFALQSRLEDLGHVAPRQAVEGELVAAEADVQLIRLLHRLDDRRRQAGRVLDGRLDLRRDLPQ
jgi:hypothetical protein